MPFTARASLFTVAARDTNNCKRKIHHFQVEWCYLHPQLAGELGLIYCKSGVRLLEMPLTKDQRGSRGEQSYFTGARAKNLQQHQFHNQQKKETP